MLKKVVLAVADMQKEDRREAERMAERLRGSRIAVEYADAECRREEAPARTGTASRSGTLYITDTPSLPFLTGAHILLYLTPHNASLPLAAYPYAVTSLEGLDADYLEKIYRRHAGLPWEIVRTGRLVVREMEEKDLDSLYEIYGGAGMTDYMKGLSEDREEEKEKLKSYIKEAYAVRGYGLWLLEERTSGRVVGRAGFTWKEGDSCPQLGFAVAVAEQRKGYCTESCRAILEYAGEELGFEEVGAFAAEGNTASHRVLRGLGFLEEGEGEQDGWRGIRYRLRLG